MKQLDNLSSLLLRDLHSNVAETDFGNVFQDLVERALARSRPGLSAQGNAGNPDLTYKDGWGWEIKTGPRTCPISRACLVALQNFENKRLIFLDTISAPFALYVCDFGNFVSQEIKNERDTATCNAVRELQIYEEETELAEELQAILRTMNTSLLSNIPSNNVRAELAARMDEMRSLR